MIQKLSNHISYYVCNELHYDSEKSEVLSYGIQIFLGTLIKVLTILGLSYVFNTFGSTLTVVISFVFFRRMIGGSHYDSYIKCYCFSVLLMIFLGAMGKTLIIPPSLLTTLAICTFSLGILVTILWVPMGTKKKTINNRRTRLRIKYKTITLLIAWSILLFYFVTMALYEIVFASVLGTFMAFFLATPFGSKFTSIKI